MIEEGEKKGLKFSQEDVAYLARLYGLKIEEEDLAEVTVRLGAILDEIKDLDQLDLSLVEPIPVFLPGEEV